MSADGDAETQASRLEGQPSESIARPGETLGGYIVEGVVGRGAMGLVYRAHDQTLRRVVALKVIAPAVAQDPEFRRRFEREWRLTATLEHPNVVPVYGAGEDAGRLFLAMRFIDGESLELLLDDRGRLEPEDAVGVVDQIAQALDAAHTHGLVHRDVKPANILIETRSGRAYLADFGLTIQTDAETRITRVGEFVGTVAYAAPEQIRGDRVNALADVYALGGVLYHALTGEVPFPSAHALDALSAHLERPPPRPTRLRDDLGSEFDHVVERAMAKDPNARFLSAGELARAARAAAAGGHYSVPAADVPCPFKGLAAFQPDDSDLFFGREELVATVVDRLEQARFIALVGPSGNGKSSLVRAGLLPELARRHGPAATVDSLVMTPGEHPLKRLADGFASRGATPGALQPDDLWADSPDLAAIGRTMTRDQGLERLVLVVDQFEEVFTLCASEDERRRFIDAVVRLPEVVAGMVVVLSLRADFYGSCAAYPQLAAALETHHSLVGPMTEEQVTRAIERPAERVGLALEPGLVETILNDVRGEPGALPLLSHCLVETWRRRSGRLLTVRGYVHTGGVRGAVARTAETVFNDKLSRDEQAIARTIFLRLTEPGGGIEDTRRRASHAELVPSPDLTGAVQRVLDALVDARLITVGEDTVEIAHEALIRHWPTLRRWLDEDREGRVLHRALTKAADEWCVLDYDQGALYRGARLSAATQWAHEHGPELNEIEREFLRASRAAAAGALETARRTNRRLRMLAGGLALLLVAAVASTVLAVKQTNRAREQGRVALSRALAGQSLDLLAQRLDLALLLGLEAYRREQTAEARSALLAAVQRTRGFKAMLSGQHEVATSVAVRPDGRRIATGGRDGRVVIWDVARRRPIAPAFRAGSSIESLAFSSRALAVGTGRGLIVLLDPDGRRRRQSFEAHTGPVSSLSFDRGGRLLLSAGKFDGTVRRWDVIEHRAVGETVDVSASTSAAGSFAPDGKTIAVPSAGGTLAVADVASGRVRAKIETGQAQTTAVAHSPDGQKLALGDSDGRIRLWELARDADRGASLGRHAGPVRAVGFSPDGRVLASTAADGELRTWDVTTRQPTSEPRQGHASAATALAYSPDGGFLATAGLDGLVIMWPTNGGPALDRTLAPAHNAISLAVDPNGRTLAIGRDDGTALLRRVADGRQVGRLAGLNGSVSVAFSPGAETLGAADSGGYVTLWDAAGRQRLTTPLRGYSESFWGIAFSPDGRTLAAWGADGTMTLWRRTARGGSPRVRLAHPGRISELAFGKDGTIATAAADSVKLWDASGLRQLGRPLTGHSGAVSDIAFKPDGTVLVSASEDGATRLWDVEHRRPLAGPLDPGATSVTEVAFSPDGRVIAIADSKGISFWDAALRARLGQALKIEGGIAAGAFTPGGERFVALGRRSLIALSVTLWSERLGDLHDRVCDLVGRDLTRAEWARFLPGEDYRRTCR